MDTAPVSTVRSSRGFEGSYCDDGYEFIEVGTGAGWRAVAGWGRDGWDLGDWPYVVYLFRGDVERASYCEGDIVIETYASAEDRERATDTTALFYWQAHGEDWAEGVTPGDQPAHLRGPYSSRRHAT